MGKAAETLHDDSATIQLCRFDRMPAYTQSYTAICREMRMNGQDNERLGPRFGVTRILYLLIRDIRIGGRRRRQPTQAVY